MFNDMFYSLDGKVAFKTEKFVVLEVNGIGYRIFVSAETNGRLKIESSVKLFVHYHVREDAVDLFGFLSGEELELFEILISVSGVGPKSAIGIMALGSVDDLRAAIASAKAEFLSRAPGIGRKTAERIVVDLKSKIFSQESAAIRLEGNLDLEDALINLGYGKNEARSAIQKSEGSDFNKRLKSALKILGEKRK